MKPLIFIALLFFTVKSYSDVQVGYGYTVTTVNNLEKAIDLDDYSGLQVFYNWSDLSFGLEGNYFHGSQRGHNLMTMSLNYYELISWIRYNFINKGKFKFYFATGVGGYQEELKIQVGQAKVKETTQPMLLVPASLGINYDIYKKFNIGLEYRIIRKIEAENQNFSLRTSLNYSF